jgi:hypothetical protein
MVSGDEGVLTISIGVRVSPEPGTDDRCKPE